MPLYDVNPLLYTYYSVRFLVPSLILLVAMIGAIVLTMHIRKQCLDLTRKIGKLVNPVLPPRGIKGGNDQSIKG